MRRIIGTAAVFGLAGLVVSYGVAWMLMWRVNVDQVNAKTVEVRQVSESGESMSWTETMLDRRDATGRLRIVRTTSIFAQFPVEVDPAYPPSLEQGCFYSGFESIGIPNAPAPPPIMIIQDESGQMALQPSKPPVISLTGTPRLENVTPAWAMRFVDRWRDAVSDSESDWALKAAEDTARIEAAGWPCLCTWGAILELSTGSTVRGIDKAPSAEYLFLHGAFLAPAQDIPPVITQADGSWSLAAPSSPSLILPWKAIWPGLLANTAFYGAILWVLWFTPGMIRRTLRRRRGACVRCGYNLSGNTTGVCPECGGA